MQSLNEPAHTIGGGSGVGGGAGGGRGPGGGGGGRGGKGGGEAIQLWAVQSREGELTSVSSNQALVYLSGDCVQAAAAGYGIARCRCRCRCPTPCDRERSCAARQR